MSGRPWTFWSRIGKSARKVVQFVIGLSLVRVRTSLGVTAKGIGTISLTFSASLEQSKLEFSGLGHHRLVPRRIPNEFDGNIVNAFQPEKLVLDILSQHRPHPTAGR